MKIQNVKAVLFDTFGTVVDWRGSITRMGEQMAKKNGIENIDWSAFANAWRAGYKPGMAHGYNRDSVPGLPLMLFTVNG